VRRLRESEKRERVMADSEEIAIRDLRVHDLRHTFASRLLAAGVSVTDISRLLGHSTLKMTAHYAHSSEASRRRAVEALSQDCRKEPEKVRIFGQK
jgi:integrase